MYTLVPFGKNINSQRDKFPELTFNGKESYVFFLMIAHLPLILLGGPTYTVAWALAHSWMSEAI